MSSPLEEPGRSQTNALIEPAGGKAGRRAGGQAGSNVNSRTGYLVRVPAANGQPSSTAAKAAELGVTVPTQQAYAALATDHLDRPAD
ncbi:hypothetical protein ACFWFZ_04065 [Streptomyces sp. NPDC060232]|uniref:hypothetical protein n=1 Tax=Streptomyces sp. NPDC060232 TaxID=3347079 RepID=UPI0036513A9D